MLELVDGLAAKYPLSEVEKKPDAEVVQSAVKPEEVTDATVFKAGLTPSKAALPVRSFDELKRDPQGEGEEVARIAEDVLRKAVEEPKANL